MTDTLKQNRTLLLTLLILIVVAAIYRVVPGRPMGFAPHLAMSLFAGAIIKDKKWAFAFPIFSMFISDLIYHFFYVQGMSSLPGFYDGQITNYVLFAGLVSVGFLMKRISVKNVILFSVLICTIFFLFSNFFVWTSGAGYARPKTMEGLIMVYTDGLPFFGKSILATLVFSGVLFSIWKLVIEPKRSRSHIHHQ